MSAKQVQKVLGYISKQASAKDLLDSFKLTDTNKEKENEEIKSSSS